jgi:hypothetical protein
MKVFVLLFLIVNVCEMKIAFFALLLVFSCASNNNALFAETFNYVLSADSTITPYSGAVQIGDSEPLTGIFSWTTDPGNSNATILAYFVTSLDFTSADFTVTDVSPDGWINETQTNGDAFFTAEVNWLEADNNPYLLGSISAGTYGGPATAPTSLEFDSVGLSQIIVPGSAPYSAKAFIDAKLVSVTPEPSTWALMLGGLSLLAFLRGHVHRRCD